MNYCGSFFCGAFSDRARGFSVNVGAIAKNDHSTAFRAGFRALRFGTVRGVSLRGISLSDLA